MKYWRMRMRKGWHGPDMFRKCRANGLAAIHYDPVEDVNLSNFSERTLPPEWIHLEPSQSGSLKKVAWHIRGGDVIYVAESNPSRIVGVGRVKGAEGAAAYRFRADTPIVDVAKHPWRHLIDVEWEQDFAEVPYPKPWAPQPTVLELKQSEISNIKKLIGGFSNEDKSGSKAGRKQNSFADEIEEAIHLRQLEEAAYTRYTTEALIKIDRRHAKLCNAFTVWMLSSHKIACQVERRNIDLTFRVGEQSALVEFKVAYDSDPKPAIREALGQILEYNHYPPRKTHNHWILVLDCEPTKADRLFLKTLRQYGLPLSYGWQTSHGFEFSPECPLYAKKTTPK